MTVTFFRPKAPSVSFLVMTKVNINFAYAKEKTMIMKMFYFSDLNKVKNN